MSVALVVTPQPLSSPPRVRLSVTDTDGTNGPLRLIRRHVASGEVFPVITSTGAARLVNGLWAGFDYHCPLNTAVRYEAVAPGGGALSTPHVLPGSVSWLVHPSVPELSVPLAYVESMEPGSRPTRAVTLVTLSGQGKRISGGRRAPRTASAVLAFRKEQLAALNRLLDDDSALLLQLHQAAQFDVSWQWISPTDAPVSIPNARARGGLAGWPYRLLSLSYTECTQPDVDLVALFTFGDTDGLSFGEIDDRFGTFGNIDDNVWA